MIVYLVCFPTTVLCTLVLFVEYVDRIAFTPLVDNEVKCSEKDVGATKTTTMDCVPFNCTTTIYNGKCTFVLIC